MLLANLSTATACKKLRDLGNLIGDQKVGGSKPRRKVPQVTNEARMWVLLHEVLTG